MARRVKQGEHDIPEPVIRRRYSAARQYLKELYAPKVDAWGLYDNAGTAPVLLNWSEKP